MSENKTVKLKNKKSSNYGTARTVRTDRTDRTVRTAPKKSSKVTKLPKLRDLSKKSSNKKYKYHINDSDFKRRRAINEGIKSKKTKTAQIKAAKDKKARFNVLRIYRRYKNPKECKIITKDMRYIDRKYLGPDAKTSDIC